MIQFRLPFPPTVNTYYRSVSMGMFKNKRTQKLQPSPPRLLISAIGREYAQQVKMIVYPMIVGKPFPIMRPVNVYIDAIMPDARRRDLDNLTKALLDSLTKAGVWADDSQIDMLSIRRMPIDPGNGSILISIQEAL